MNETSEGIKPGGDKIALLGLFVIALLIAQLIVSSRSVILLSEPIELANTGLSISIPVGNGWQSNKTWAFHDNAFILGSSYVMNPRKPTALAQCQYRFAAEIFTPQEIFKQKALELAGMIVNTDQVQTDKLVFDWAHINTPQINLHMFIGTALLPGNHQLDIEVHEISGNADIAEKTFMSIIKKVHYKDNNLFRTGAEMIAVFKSKGIDNLIDEQKPQGFYLIEDAGKKTIGFMTDILTSSTQDNPLNIHVAGFVYIRGRSGYEQATSFQSDNNYDQFTWKGQTYRGRNKSGTEIDLNRDGTLTISKYGPDPLQESYRPGNAAIPDALLGLFSYEVLGSNEKEIAVDTISIDGKIVPTLISKMQVDEDIFADEQTAYILKFEPQDGQGFYEQVYLDKNKKIYKRLLRQEDLYTLKKASIEEIRAIFPERSKNILQDVEPTNKDLL